MPRNPFPSWRSFATALRVAAGILAWLGVVPCAKGETAGDGNPAPYVLHDYDVRALREPVRDSFAPVIELRPSVADAWPFGAASGLDESVRFLPERAILELIRLCPAPEAWDRPGAFVRLSGHRLLVRQTPPVQDQVARTLEWILSEAEQPIGFEGTVAIVDDDLIEAWRAGGGDGAALSEDAGMELDRSLAEGKRARRVGTLSGIARNGQRVSSEALTQHAYVQDYDVESTVDAAGDDPIIGYQQPGFVLEVRPFHSRGRVACEVRFHRVDASRPIPRFDTGVPEFGALELPEQTHACLETAVVGRPGQILLVGRIADAGLEPVPGGLRVGPGRSLCFFLRFAPIPLPTVPMPSAKSGRWTRLLDARILTAPLLRHRPPFGLVPYPGLAARVRADDENGVPACMAPTELVESIKALDAPGTWDLADAALDVHNGMVLARHALDSLDRVEAHIVALEARRVRAVLTKVRLLEIDPAAYDKLTADFPAVRTVGGVLDKSHVQELLSGAAQDKGLKVASSAEIAGLCGKLVHVHLSYDQTVILDYDYAPGPANQPMPEAKLGLASEGFEVNCCAGHSQDGKTTSLELAVGWLRLERPVEVAAAVKSGYRIHLPTTAAVSLETTASVKAGGWQVVGVRGPVLVGGKVKMLVALVQCWPGS